MSDICEFEVAKQQKILKILSVVVIVVVVEIADLLFVFQKFGNGLEKLEVVENTKLLNNVANLLGPGAPPRLAGTALERVHGHVGVDLGRVPPPLLLLQDVFLADPVDKLVDGSKLVQGRLHLPVPVLG